MRIYLDVCCLQRPLDDRSQVRVNVEAEAVLAILHLVEAGQLRLLTSEVIQFEAGRVPSKERRDRVAEVVKLAWEMIELTDAIEMLADEIIKSGVKPLDALHLAAASAAAADYFCTCDDKLLKKALALTGLSTKVVSPLDLIAEVTP